MLKLSPLFILFVLLFSGCGKDNVPPFENPNLTDTSGINVPLDLFVSGEVGGVYFDFYNGIKGYINEAETTTDTSVCGDTSLVYYIHSGKLWKPGVAPNSISISISRCVQNDSLLSERLDSMFLVGPVDFANDLTGMPGARIEYIDGESYFWTTALGDNNNSSTRFFEISGFIKSEDPSEPNIVFGRFSGMLYSTTGDSIDIRKGQFKIRLGKY